METIAAVSITVSLPVVSEFDAPNLAPLAHPQELFAAAVLDGTLATEHLLPTLAWAAVVLVVAPAYVIYVFTAVAPAGTATLHVDGGTVETTLDAAFPAFTTPMTAALLAGITGLFLMQTAAAADSRLVVAGYRPHQVVLARLGLLVAVAGVATGVSTVVMLTAVTPDRLAPFVLGTALTALVYGMVGVLVGVLLDRLLGVYLILFGSMLDLFVFQNPLATETPAVATLLPGHYPLELAVTAGFSGSPDLTTLGLSLAYLGVLSVVTMAAFFREMRVS